jgi:predicted PurR-regulated permease PerM
MGDPANRDPATSKAAVTRGGRTGTEWLWDAAKLLVLAVAAVAATLLAWQLSHVALLVFAAVLVAALLRAVAFPIARFMPVPDRWSVLLAGLLIGAALAGFLVLMGAQVRTQATALLQGLPDLVDAAENRLGIDGLGDWLDQQRLAVLDGGGLVVNVASYSTWVFTVVAYGLVVLSAGVYLALSPRVYLDGVLKLVPEDRQARARDTLETVGRALMLWLLGQLAAMVLVGVLTTLGLLWLGIPSALALGVLAGLFEFVPLVGPVASAAPAIVVGLAEGPATALWVLGLYVVIQQVEGMLIVPLIQARTVDLPPVVTIFAIIAFGALFGALGLLLATPLAVVCLVLVKKLWVRETLGEDVTVPGEEAVGTSDD